jgi:hypothetical protein
MAPGTIRIGAHGEGPIDPRAGEVAAPPARVRGKPDPRDDPGRAACWGAPPSRVPLAGRGELCRDKVLRPILVGNRRSPRDEIALDHSPFTPTFHWNGKGDDPRTAEVSGAMNWANYSKVMAMIQGMGMATWPGGSPRSTVAESPRRRDAPHAVKRGTVGDSGNLDRGLG